MTKTQRTLIAAYAERRGGTRLRITRQGAVHVYGPIPNSIETGWWFAGWDVELLTQLEAEA